VVSSFFPFIFLGYAVYIHYHFLVSTTTILFYQAFQGSLFVQTARPAPLSSIRFFFPLLISTFLPCFPTDRGITYVCAGAVSLTNSETTESPFLSMDSCLLFIPGRYFSSRHNEAHFALIIRLPSNFYIRVIPVTSAFLNQRIPFAFLLPSRPKFAKPAVPYSLAPG